MNLKNTLKTIGIVFLVLGLVMGIHLVFHPDVLFFIAEFSFALLFLCIGGIFLIISKGTK